MLTNKNNSIDDLLGIKEFDYYFSSNIGRQLNMLRIIAHTLMIIGIAGGGIPVVIISIMLLLVLILAIFCVWKLTIVIMPFAPFMD